MADTAASGGVMSKKRKHEGGTEGQASPAKKAKSAKRSKSERKARKNSKEQKAGGSTSLVRQDDAALSKREAKRQKRRERRKEAAAAGTLVKKPKDVVRPQDATDYDAVAEDEQRKKQKHEARRQAEDRRKKQRKVTNALQTAESKYPKWTLSDSAGGRFIDHDPVFVRHANGEEYLITAVSRELQVLSVETSLLVRTLPAAEGRTIVGFALESAQSNLVYVADNNCTIRVWDWTNDLPARTSNPFAGAMKSITAVRLNDEDDEALLPRIVHFDGKDHLQTEGEPHPTEHTMDSLHVLGNAEYIVARGPDAVVLGSRKEDRSYVWIELPLSKPSTSLDARIVLPSPGPKKSSQRRPQLQLAIGNEDGQIQLYEDVSSLFATIPAQQGLPTPRVLHWHRTAVSSVKFSPDGKYLISGGKETVLVLWQLETGKKQYLPHLTSEIQRISVNAQGDRYALQMGDNSIMVLSTAELKPVANFAGLQMQMPNVEDVAHPVAAVLHSKQPRQLLAIVPSTLPKSLDDVAPRPFVQAFDLRTARHITRQALTRNNATDLNIGPEETPVLAPDVKHIAISHNGEWLATVDEWMPPTADVWHLTSNRKGLAEAQRSRREVYLKIWHWDSTQDLWTLSTRADAPHSRVGNQAIGAGRVLALASDSASNCFATVGEDGCVKLWKPKTRMRGGVPVKDAQDVNLIEWTCRRSVQLSSNQDRADSPLDTVGADSLTAATVAFSGDGSLLAVSTTASTLNDSLPSVMFIDTASGAIKSTNSNLSDDTPTTSIAFLERFFISVTQKAAFVWDLVSETMQQKCKLPSPSTPGLLPQLAVNEADQTFAFVTAAETKGYRSRVDVRSIQHTGKMYQEEFKTDIVKILSGKGSRGFVLLFADATARTLQHAGASNSKTISALAERSTALASAEVGEEMEVDQPDRRAETAELLKSSAATEGRALEVDEDDRPVVRPEQLAGIFDVGQSFAMPPVKNMFSAVVELFARRPQQVVA